MSSRNNRFDAQNLQMDKALFCLDACHLSAENSERVSLKSVIKNSTSENFEGKKRPIKNKNSNKKKEEGHDGPVTLT